MKATTPLIFILALAISSMIACNKSNSVNCSNAWTLQVADEVTALSQAASAYGSNPTNENCEAYRDALNNYIDEYERFRSCARNQGDLESFEEDLEDARDDIEDLDCSE